MPAEAKLFKCNLRIPPRMMATARNDKRVASEVAQEEKFFKARSERMNLQYDSRCGTKKSKGERPSLGKLRKASIPLKCCCTDDRKKPKTPAATPPEKTPARTKPVQDPSPAPVINNGVITPDKDGNVPLADPYRIRNI